MGEIKFVGSLLLIALFVMAIVGYVVNFQNDNSAVVLLTDEQSMGGLQTSLEENLTLMGYDVNQASIGFMNSTADEQGTDVTTKTGGQFKLGMKSVLDTFSSIRNVINQNIFGGKKGLIFFMTMLGVFMTYVAIRYVWKTWKGGNPD